MKEHPIIFSSPMVKAILDKRKTQTRRVIKLNKRNEWLLNPDIGWSDEYIKDPENALIEECPYGQVGDKLWVKETWWCPQKGLPVAYKANLEPQQAERQIWKSSLFMPRWASRILLEITEVRAERLQEITEEDAIKEGCKEGITMPGGHYTAKWYFRALWDFLNAKRGYGWDKNPWVWVISFELVKQ
jgi:hypothetical protein